VELDATDSVGKRPFGVALNAAGVVLLGRQDGNNVVRGTLTNFTFPVGITAGDDPGTLAMSPDGTKALVSNFNDAAVGVIDVASNIQTNTVNVASSPYQVGYLPDGTKFYVGTGEDGVKVFNASTLAAGPTIAAGTSLNGMAFNASGSRLYVSSIDGKNVVEINTASDAILRALPVGARPQEIAISKDGTELWVADELDGIQVYSVTNGALMETIPYSDGAFGMAMSPDGTTICVTFPKRGVVAIVDRATRALRDVFLAGVPRRAVFSSDGTKLVVADEVLGAALFVLTPAQ
jgi:YVTN family beta-propeller protein